MQTHRDPEYWDQPNQFIPERFTKEEAAKRHPFSYVPFSSGQRNCVGKVCSERSRSLLFKRQSLVLGAKYAYMTMKCVIVTVLRRYRLSTTLRMDEIVLKQELTLKAANGFMVRLHNRI